MARIRTIKPEFPQSESMGRVSRESRYCFILLWTISDDEGRLRGNSRMLASLLFPYDGDAPKMIDKWLDELELEGCIARYVVDGNSYIEIINWSEHQRIDKPSKSKLPERPEDSGEFENIREDSRGLPVGREGNGREGNGREQDSSSLGTDVAEVFGHWQKVMNKARAKLDDKRRKLIKARLDAGYSVDDLKQAITGCSLSPYHMGENENGSRYDGIDLILRDASKVDQFLGYFRMPPRPRNRNDANLTLAQHVIDEFTQEAPDARQH